MAKKNNYNKKLIERCRVDDVITLDILKKSSRLILAKNGKEVFKSSGFFLMKTGKFSFLFYKWI